LTSNFFCDIRLDVKIIKAGREFELSLRLGYEQMSKKPRFISIKLTEESRANLLQAIPPLYENVFADHVTLRYKANEIDVNIFQALKEKITKIDLRVFGYASNEKGQAVCVVYVGEIDGKQIFLPPTNNKVPHITISCADGVKPVYSNELLEDADNILRIDDLHLEGNLEIE